MPLAAVALLLALTHVRAPLAELPFELIGNHIYLKGESQGRPISVLLDSGAGMSVADSGLAERWKVPMQGSSLPVRGAGSTTLQAKMLQGFKVKLAGTDIEQPVLIGIPLSSLAPLEGRPIECIIGFDFFQEYVVNIDYSARKVRLFEPSTFAYSGKGKEIPFRLASNHPHLNAEVEVPGIGKIPVEAMIDTGAGTGISLTGRMVKAQGLDAKLPPSPKFPVGAGTGGETLGRMSRIDKLSFAGFDMQKPIALVDLTEGGATGTSANYDVLIGGDIMKRFNVTFDYSKKRLFLEPNDSYRKPFTGEQTGLLLMAEGEKLRDFRVMWVVKGSPAEEAGMQVGDRILKVDGKDAAEFELSQLRQILRVPNHRWDLLIDRNGEQRKVTVQGRSMY